MRRVPRTSLGLLLRAFLFGELVFAVGKWEGRRGTLLARRRCCRRGRCACRSGRGGFGRPLLGGMVPVGEGEREFGMCVVGLNVELAGAREFLKPLTPIA